MPSKHWFATALLVLLAGCGNSQEQEKERQPREAAAPLATSADPGFSLRGQIHAQEIGDGGDAPHKTAYWQITNTREEPLTIHRILFNDEWDPAILNATTRRPVSGPKYPQTLTIGESRLLPWKSNVKDWDYGKEVIYIDLYTDRGNFRYRPFGGFEALED